MSTYWTPDIRYISPTISSKYWTIPNPDNKQMSVKLKAYSCIYVIVHMDNLNNCLFYRISCYSIE